jgi:hypothetical protein
MTADPDSFQLMNRRVNISARNNKQPAAIRPNTALTLSTIFSI